MNVLNGKYVIQKEEKKMPRKEIKHLEECLVSFELCVYVFIIFMYIDVYH